MFRELAIATAIAGAAIGAAPVAAGEPNEDNLYFDRPGRYDSDVPGMNYDAHSGGPCDNFQIFTFGRGPGGQPMQCHWIPNQWPPVYTGFWVVSPQLYGVQEIGSPCPGPQSAAQAPDGRPLLCLGEQGWQAGFFTGNGFFPT
jgi:hypothetical protein